MRSLKLDRYQLEGLVARNESATVYRARDVREDEAVVIKVVRDIGLEEGERLLEAYQNAPVLRRIDHAAIARFYGFYRSNDTFYFVEEYCEGDTLDEVLAEGPIPVGRALEVVTQIAEALQYCHDRGIIHLGVKPRNILVSTENSGSEAWRSRLLGLGQVLLSDTIEAANEPVTSLCYMPPEQAGILSKGPDPRSDVYSLGVILYQALTGRVPYEGDDAVALVHHMVASVPTNPSQYNTGIDPGLEALVMRAIAKNPDDRFGSMEQFLSAAREVSRSGDEGDAGSSRASLDTVPLIERELEFKTLRARLEQAVLGRGAFVLITGDEGSGKTTLVDEFRRSIEPGRGLLLWSQASEFESNRPYSPLREAVRQFVEHVRTLSSRAQQVVRRRVEGAVGNFGKELLLSIPEIEALLPEVEEVVALDPERALQRSTKTILNLFRSLSGPGLPVVLFIDDYQAVDKGTREIVERLRKEVEQSNLVIICTETVHESDNGRGDGVCGDAGAGDTIHIRLNPLTLAGCLKLFEYVLGRDGSDVQDFATIAFERCGGIPRLLLDLLKTLQQEIGASADEELGDDLLKLQTLIPEANVEAFVTRHWNDLSDVQREIMAVAAVVGKKFSSSHVHKVVGGAREDVEEAVREGLSRHILSSLAVFGADTYSFAQRRIHDYVYGSIDPERRAAIHARVADVLRDAEDQETNSYDIALHYLRSNDTEAARTTSLRAARAAKQAYANKEAIFFFAEALKLLDSSEIEVELQIVEDLGDVCALDGQYEEAETCYRTSLESLTDPFEKARLEGKIGAMYFRRGRNEAAIDHMTRGLEWLGLESPTTKRGLWWSIFFNTARQAIHTCLPRRLLAIKNSRAKAIGSEAVNIFHNLAYANYFIDLHRTLEIHLRQLNLAERLGESRELAHTYSSHGVVCSLIPLHKRAMKYQMAGLEMRKRLDDRWGIGQSYAFLGVCSYYRTEISQAVEHFKQSIRILEGMGDQWEIEAAYSHLGFCHIFLGEIDDAEKVNRVLLDLSEEIHDLKFTAVAKTSLAEVDLMRGNLERALKYVDEALSIEADNFTKVMAMRVRGQVLLRLEHRDQAIRVLEESVEIIERHRLRNDYLVANYIALASAYLSGADPNDRRLRRVKSLVSTAMRLARRFTNHLGLALRVRAMYYALRGNDARAERDFDESKNVLTKQGRVYELARTLLETARWRQRTEQTIDDEDVERAVEIYRKIGAQLDMQEARKFLGLRTSGDNIPQKHRTEHRQLSSLFKMSRAISSILDLDRLVIQITDLAVEVTGGERGFLFLADGDGAPQLRGARGVGKKDISFSLGPESMSFLEETWRNGVATSMSTDGLGAGRSEANGISILSVPLRIGERTIGLIHVENRLTKDLYTDDDLEFVTAFASQAAISVQNALSYQEAEEINLQLENKVQERTQELLTSKREIENANRLKSEFLANMSHELRTPLNAIIAMSEIMSEGTFGELNEKQNTYTNQILDSGVHLLSLINDVLDLSKIEAGQLTMNVDPFDLNDLLKGSLSVVKERALRHNVTVKVEPDPDIEIVHADALRIKQVIYNLLSNAVKFTPERGSVTLASKAAPGRVIVTVEDTGIGISEEDQQIIFDEFRQADSSYTRRYEGTGLGLALSKKFVDMHGGKIWVESEIDKGSRFTFWIPLQQTPQPSGAPGEVSSVEVSRQAC